jgi:lipoprotein-releasing system permease protein
VVSIISVVGVALGVTALIVVLSVMSGFEEDLKSKILGAHAHVVVEKYGDDFLEYEAVEEKIRAAPRVQSAAAFVLGDAMISTDGGLSGALVKGIDPRSSDAVGELRENLERGRVEYLLEPKKIPGACGRSFLPPRPPVPVGGSSTSATVAEPLVPGGVALGGSAECTGRVLPGIIVGKELARTLRAQVGDAVKLVSPVSDEIGPLGPTPKLRRYRVAGIFYSGMYEYDAKLAYVAMKRAQKFFGMRGKATGVETKIDDIDASGLVVSDLERRLGGRPYRVKDWREMNKELFSALLLEKIAMFVALTMIITVASFLIVATLVMIVLQRGREIAILKSVGASAASVMKIFVIQGVIVGVGGALLGVGAGVGICLLLETVGLRLDERVFYIEQLPVVLDWTEVGIIAASAMVITYLATIYPAMTAAILRPVDGLRED